MKRVISIALILLLPGAMSFGQNGVVVIFSDVRSMNCDIVDSGGLIQFHVVHLYSTGSTSSSFSVPIPSCMNGATYIGESVSFSQFTGDTQLGITIEYEACISSPIHLLMVSLFGSGISDECCHIIPLGHPESASGKIEVTDCASSVHMVGASYATVNETGLCQCGHPDGIPPEVSAPSPPDSASGVPLYAVLSWEVFDPLKPTSEFTMFFGKDPDPPEIIGVFHESLWDPGALEPMTTYYWKVGATFRQGGATAQGPVWRFTTFDPSSAKTSTWGAIKALYRDD